MHSSTRKLRALGGVRRETDNLIFRLKFGYRNKYHRLRKYVAYGMLSKRFSKNKNVRDRRQHNQSIRVFHIDKMFAKHSTPRTSRSGHTPHHTKHTTVYCLVWRSLFTRRSRGRTDTLIALYCFPLLIGNDNTS